MRSNLLKVSRPWTGRLRYSFSVHYTLIGNFGAGNLGDEALKEFFLRRFPEAERQRKAPTAAMSRLGGKTELPAMECFESHPPAQTTSAEA